MNWSGRAFTAGSPPEPARIRLRHYPRGMRDAYQEQLDDLADGLAGMCYAGGRRPWRRPPGRCWRSICSSPRRSSPRTSGSTRSARSAEEKAFALLALQAPVATDLRIVVSAIHGAGDIERDGRPGAARRPGRPPPPPAAGAPRRGRAYFAEMGRVGRALARKAGERHPHPGPRPRPQSWRATTTPWTTCTGTCSRVLMDRNWTPRRRAGRRHHAAGPLLRALRRPRGRRRPPDRLRGDRPDARPAHGLITAFTRRSSGHCCHPDAATPRPSCGMPPAPLPQQLGRAVRAARADVHGGGRGAAAGHRGAAGAGSGSPSR